MGHPTACAAALAVQRVIEQDNLLENVQRQGEALMQALNSRFGQHPYIGDIRGRGLFIGLEFVADRDSKQPFDSALQIHTRVKKAALDAGLICYPMGGTIDGKNGSHVLLAPPFIIDENHVAELVDKLALALDQVFNNLSN
jgi:adenosylmethionine-8-amino-7-oxononanoate aminotransferase